MKMSAAFQRLCLALMIVCLLLSACQVSNGTAEDRTDQSSVPTTKAMSETETETQTEPDCVSHGKEWYTAGETYTHTTVYEVIKL